MSWEKVKISDVCEIDNGFAFKSNNYVSNEGARVIRITNVQKGKIVDNDPKFYPYDLLLNLDRYEIFEGDIMMSLTGNVGRVGKFPKEMLPAYINQRICRVKPLNDRIDKNYLFQLLNSNEFEKDAIYASAGAAQLNLSTNWVANYEIPLPPLDEQKAIAEKLDKADALRKKDQDLLKYYDELAQSVFIDMFGDPVKNEKGWEKSILKDICNVKGGKRVPLKHKLVKEDTGFPYIKAGNIKNGKVTTENLEFLLPQTQKLISRYIVSKGDVCITVVGANIGDIGIVPLELHNANLTENADKLIIRDNERMSNHFLCYQLQSDFLQKQIGKKIMAVGVPKLAIFRVEELELLLPPLPLQQKFANIIENIEEQKKKVKQQALESENLFQALLQESFS